MTGLKYLAAGADDDVVTPIRTMSLDDLYTEARKLGEVELGGRWTNKESAEIRLNGVGDDYINIVATDCATVKENLAMAIDRARRVRAFYKTELGR